MIKETTGKYFVSVVVEKVEVKKEKVIPTSIVGIDLGVKDLIILQVMEKNTQMRKYILITKRDYKDYIRNYQDKSKEVKTI